MNMTCIEQAPLVRAYLLINENKSNTDFKKIQNEIIKMCEAYGDELNKNFHLLLFNNIDFNKVNKQLNTKQIYFLKDFPNFIKIKNFIEVFSELLKYTINKNNAIEIYNSINKIYKLNIEQQLKIIISFKQSNIEKYKEDASQLLFEKCEEIYKEKQEIGFNQNIIECILNFLNNYDDGDDESIKNIIQTYKNFFNNQKNASQIQTNDNQEEDENILINIENYYNEKIDKKTEEKKIKLIDLLSDLGPLIINQDVDLSNIEIISNKIELFSLIEFINFMLDNETYIINEQILYINKILLESLDKNLFEKLKNLNLNTKVKWDLSKLYLTFKKDIDNFDKTKILNSLAINSFTFKSKENFDFFIDILTKFNILTDGDINPDQNFFSEFLFKKWKNEKNQLQLFDLLITNKEISDLSPYSIKNYKGNKIHRDVELNAYTSSKNQYLIENWRTTKVIEILLDLSSGELYEEIKKLFEWPKNNIPEILILAIININTIDYTKNKFMNELIIEIMPQILNNKNPRQKLIDEIWNTNKNIVIYAFNILWEKQPDLMILSSIFDISNSLLKDGLLTMVNSKYFNFSVHLALLAARKDYLHVEQWIIKNVENFGDEFIQTLLSYLEKNLIIPLKDSNIETDKNAILEKAQLSFESLSIILNTIKNLNDKKIFSSNIKKTIEDVTTNIYDIYDELQDQCINSGEIEEEANKLLKLMFEEKISVDYLIDVLKKYKKSTDKKQNEIFACLIHSLIDEHRFFQQYPPKPLKILSELYGKIINNKLIDGVIETLVLNYILEGIKTESGPLYNFGALALSEFIGKISHWPTYMKKLLELEQLKNNKNLYNRLLEEYEKTIANKEKEKDNDEVKNIVDDNDSKNNDKNKENLNMNELKSELTGETKIFLENNHLNKDKLKDIQNPPEDFTNKISISLKDLTENNIQEKVSEIQTIINNENMKLRWFSYIFISTKITNNKNIQYELLDNFLISMNNQTLNKFIIKDTVNIIKKLLLSEDNDIKNKDHLNNLGTWLGINTLEKKRPVLAKDIDFKELIIESFKSGKLSTIIPFVCRVFEHITNSKIFSVSNPWINAILSLLLEIIEKNNLDSNVKNEVDSFFDKINVNKKSISPTKYLEKNLLKMKSCDFAKSHKYNININNNELTTKVSYLENYINNILSTIQSDKNSNTNIKTQADIINILSYIINESIRQTIPEIMDLYVNNPVKSTINLVSKDFLFENNVDKYKAALDNTLKIFIKSFSIISVKDKLKSNIDNLIDSILRSKKITPNIISKIKQLPNSEFINIASEYIEQFIMKEAQNKLNINKKVKEEIDKKKQGIPNNNNNILEYKKKLNGLPNLLKPNEDCISENEYKIYENFNSMYNKINLYENDNIKCNFLNTIYRLLKEVIDGISNNKSSNILENYKSYDLCMRNIETISQTLDNNNNNEDEKLVYLENIIIDNKINNLELCTKLAVDTFKYIVDSAQNNNLLLLNIYLYILKGWIKLNNCVSKKITEELFDYDVDIYIKFKHLLHFYLIKGKIIDLNIYEDKFLELLKNDCVNGNINMFAIKLLKELHSSNNETKIIFTKIKKYFYDNNSYNYYLLFNKKPLINEKKEQINENIDLKNIIEIFQTIIDNEENENVHFIDNLDILTDEIKFIQIIKNILSISLNIYEIQELFSNDLFFPENVAFFIYNVISLSDGTKYDKLDLFNKILYNIIDIFHNDYIKSGKNFDQKKYYKLFLNLIYLINNNKNEQNILNSEYTKINYLLSICEALKIISPKNYPGFIFAWLDLISLNYFITNMIDNPLEDQNHYKYESYLALIIEILSFLTINKNQNINIYSLKILLDKIYKFFFLLCKTYPEFIISYSIILIINLSISSDEGKNNIFLQLKNLILSSNNSISFISDLKNKKDTNKSIFKENYISFSLLENNNFPSFIINLLFGVPESENTLKNLIEKYIKEPEKEEFMEDILNFLDNKTDEKEIICMYHGIMLYWCKRRHKYLSENKIKSKKLFYNFYLYLIYNSKENHKNYLIDSILNTLRFPCFQTINYSILFQELFLNIDNEDIEEHLLLNLLERAVYHPIPWGIKYTFNNLMTNENYLKMEKKYIDKSGEILKNFLKKLNKEFHIHDNQNENYQ